MKEKDFDYVREDVERYKKQKDEKFVSLNEAARMKEKEENKTRAETRKKELQAREEKLPTTYEITLKLADQPGLPPPMTNKTVVAISSSDERTLHGGRPKPPEVKVAVQAATATPAPAGASPAEPVATTAGPEAKPKPGDEDLDLPEEDTGVAADVNLKEAQRILIDLILLASGKSGVAARLQ